MSTNSLSSNYSENVRENRGRLLLAVLLSIVIATAANLALYAAVSAAIPQVGAWPGAGAGQIIGSTIVYLTIGAVVMVVIRRWSSRPARTYLIAATIGLLLSLILPASAGMGYDASGAPAASLVTVLTLSIMHVVSYLVSVPLYIRWGLR